MTRGLGALLLILLGVLGAAGCSTGPDLCERTEVKRVAAPEGDRAAVVFVKNCGATTGYSTHVSVVAPDQAVGDDNEIFSADGDDGVVPLGPDNALALRVTWSAADRLMIEYPAGTRIFTQQPDRGPIKIDYRES
ncbi:hypothetical protein [Microlunatus sp. GCM10028923]|uniref:hypothetical protein n=1 Tax=Microlunatus sp. GCM10028923 TaxID=3273400 RepID=UPI00361D62A9